MEPSQANVRSIDALGRVRTALVRCVEELKLAVAESEAEVGKAVDWVSGERVMHWRNRQQRLAEEVNGARSALFRKQTVTSSESSRPSVVDEKRALERARATLADAEVRARRTRVWATELPREQAIFKRGVSPLAGMVERDLPAGVHALGRMIEALERYRRDELPDLAALLDAQAQAEGEAGSMRRGTDASAPEVEPPAGAEERPAGETP